MTTLEVIVEELKSLPTARLEEAASYVHQLKRKARTSRSAILEKLGSLFTPEEVDQMEKTINVGCEQINERSW